MASLFLLSKPALSSRTRSPNDRKFFCYLSLFSVPRPEAEASLSQEPGLKISRGWNNE